MKIASSRNIVDFKEPRAVEFEEIPYEKDEEQNTDPTSTIHFFEKGHIEMVSLPYKKRAKPTDSNKGKNAVEWSGLRNR